MFCQSSKHSTDWTRSADFSLLPLGLSQDEKLKPIDEEAGKEHANALQSIPSGVAVNGGMADVGGKRTVRGGQGGALGALHTARMRAWSASLHLAHAGTCGEREYGGNGGNRPSGIDSSADKIQTLPMHEP